MIIKLHFEQENYFKQFSNKWKDSFIKEFDKYKFILKDVEDFISNEIENNNSLNDAWKYLNNTELKKKENKQFSYIKKLLHDMFCDLEFSINKCFNPKNNEINNHCDFWYCDVKHDKHYLSTYIWIYNEKNKVDFEIGVSNKKFNNHTKSKRIDLIIDNMECGKAVWILFTNYIFENSNKKIRIF